MLGAIFVGTVIFSSRLTGVSQVSDINGVPKFVQRYERKGSRAAFSVMVKRGVAIIAYLIFGALVFYQIEHCENQSSTAVLQRTIMALRIELNTMKNVSYTVLDEYEYLVKQREIERLRQDKKWDFYQSLYFASTVTTTIGYGHITPQTQEGRLFLMIFAVVGIPLNILALASVGEHITIGIFYMLKWISNRCCRTSKLTNINIKVMFVSIAMKLIMLLLGGCLYEATEEWTFIDSMYYCFVALATIGFGDMVPNRGQPPDTGSEKALWFVKVLYISIGLSLVSTVFTAMSNAMEEIQAVVACLKKKRKGGKSRKTTITNNETIPDEELCTNPPMTIIRHPTTGRPLTYVTTTTITPHVINAEEEISFVDRPINKREICRTKKCFWREKRKRKQGIREMNEGEHWFKRNKSLPTDQRKDPDGADLWNDLSRSQTI